MALITRSATNFSFPVDIVPPAESANLPEVTAAQRAENTARFNREDSIRNAISPRSPHKPRRRCVRPRHRQ
ncbi:MAG: hypothetical protein ACLU9X_10380 [Alistipes shahii]